MPEERAEQENKIKIQEKKSGEFIKDIVKKVKTIDKRTLIAASVAGVFLLIGAVYFIFFHQAAPKFVYDVAVIVRDQNSADKNDDKRNTLNYGDVLLAQKEGHKWSNTEKVNYLILKMELSEEEADKLTSPKEKRIKFKDLPAEEQEALKKEGREDEPRTERLIAREYRIKMEKYFPDFKPLDLLNKQPYQDKIYTWSIVEKKR